MVDVSCRARRRAGRVRERAGARCAVRGGTTRTPSPAVRAEGHRARARRVLLRGARGAERRAVFLRCVRRASLRGRAARARSAAHRGAGVVRREPASRGVVRFAGRDAKPSASALLATARPRPRAGGARGAGGADFDGTVARPGGTGGRAPVQRRVRRRDAASAGAGRVRGGAASEGARARRARRRPRDVSRRRGRSRRTTSQRIDGKLLLRPTRAARRSSGGFVFLRAERARRDARVPGELPRNVRVRGGEGDVRRRRARGKSVRAVSARRHRRYRRG